MFRRRAILSAIPFAALCIGLLLSAACATATEVRLQIFSDVHCTEAVFKIYGGRTLEEARTRSQNLTVGDAEFGGTAGPTCTEQLGAEVSSDPTVPSYFLGEVTLYRKSSSPIGAVIAIVNYNKRAREFCNGELGKKVAGGKDTCVEAGLEFRYQEGGPATAEQLYIRNECKGLACGGKESCKLIEGEPGCLSKTECAFAGVGTPPPAKDGGVPDSSIVCIRTTPNPATFRCAAGSVTTTPNCAQSATNEKASCLDNSANPTQLICAASCAENTVLCCTQPGPGNNCCITMVAASEIPVRKTTPCAPTARACFSDADCEGQAGTKKCVSIGGGNSLAERGFGRCSN